MAPFGFDVAFAIRLPFAVDGLPADPFDFEVLRVPGLTAGLAAGFFAGLTAGLAAPARFFAGLAAGLTAGLAARFFDAAGFPARFAAFAGPFFVRFEVLGLAFLVLLDAGFLAGFFFGFVLVLPREGVMPISCQMCLMFSSGHVAGLLCRDWGLPVSILILP